MTKDPIAVASERMPLWATETCRAVQTSFSTFAVGRGFLTSRDEAATRSEALAPAEIGSPRR